jgi:hypothetical protein
MSAVIAVRQPPRSSSILAEASRDPRRACTALTEGLKATSLDGRLVLVMAVIWWQSAGKLGEVRHHWT